MATEVKPTVVNGMYEQILVRLIASGMYPIRTAKGDWMYFVTTEGRYIGTWDNTDFNSHWKKQLLYMGEGQLTEKELEEVRKVDYTATDEYLGQMEKWREKGMARKAKTGQHQLTLF